MKDIKTSMMLYQGEQYETDDLENRRLFINDVIDSDVIDTIVYHILRYNRKDKDIPVESRKQKADFIVCEYKWRFSSRWVCIN